MNPSISTEPYATATPAPTPSPASAVSSKPELLALDGADSNLLSIAISPDGRMAYVTTWDGKSYLEEKQPETYDSPIFLKSIRLSDFSKGESLTVNRRTAGSPSSIVAEPRGKDIYFQAQQGGILKMDPTDFNKQSSIGLQPGFLVVEGSVSTGPGAVTDPQGKYLYVSGTASTNVKEIEGKAFASTIEGGIAPVAGVDEVIFTGVYRVDLSSFKSAGFLPLINDVQGLPLGMWMNPHGNYAYMAYRNAQHLVLARIRLDTFTTDNKLELSRNEGDDVNGAIDPKGTFGFFSTYAGKLLKINLEAMNIQASYDLPDGWQGGPVLLGSQFTYVGGNDGQIARFDLADNQWKEPLSVQLPPSDGQYPRVAQSAAWDPQNQTMYWAFGQYDGTGVIAKVPLR